VGHLWNQLSFLVLVNVFEKVQFASGPVFGVQQAIKVVEFVTVVATATSCLCAPLFLLGLNLLDAHQQQALHH